MKVENSVEFRSNIRNKIKNVLNVSDNKAGNLEKSILIDCEYNSKFKKWVPKNISKNPIIDKKNLQLILNKKKY